jgi:alkanesulfonate monooxygenase SsuD/methylene tetrahydromethanopterin reductase-like flavin-dependent oxidoreductase (luciferase family)
MGIGVGWNEDEMEHHGVDPRQRRAQTRERMLAVRRLWTEEEASFDGEFVRFSPSICHPKPTQRPGPPVLMGGAGGPVTFRHIAEYCDGWMPLHGRGDPMSKVADLRRAVRDAGRDPDEVGISIYGCPQDEDVIDGYRSLGIERVIFWLPSDAGADVVAAATAAARHVN